MDEMQSIHPKGQIEKLLIKIRSEKRLQRDIESLQLWR